MSILGSKSNSTHRSYDPPPYSSSWNSEISALADKIKLDVTHKPLDKHSISQGIKLVSIAADEYEQGNESVALNIYLTGVDKIIMALPNKTDMNTKNALSKKLKSVEERMGIVSENGVVADNDLSFFAKIYSIISAFFSYIFTTSDLTYQDPMVRFKQLGQSIANWSVALAIFIKQSPLPDFFAFLFGCLLQLGFWLDSRYSISKRIQQLGIQMVKLGLEVDQQYRLHEFISEGLCMIITAGVKAAVAFKETPRTQ
ncbi:hypothetical protein G6F56_005093 [Rhizopus delemar]|nr:hypothetical protein G6F56_005093 [Rhizopus delemar]